MSTDLPPLLIGSVVLMTWAPALPHTDETHRHPIMIDDVWFLCGR